MPRKPPIDERGLRGKLGDLPQSPGRRRFVAATAGVATSLAHVTGSYAAAVPRIGFLGAADPVGYATRIEALRAGLRDQGYVEGKTIAFEFRWAEGRYERLPALAAELVRLRVDVIVTHAVNPTLAAKNATGTIPIVMTNVGDAVANGIVPNLARPGGNITGDTFFGRELPPKRLELLKLALPQARRIGVLSNPDNPGNVRVLESMHEAAEALKLSLVPFTLGDPGALAATFATISAARCDAVALVEDAKTVANVARIAEAALRNRLPSIGFVEYADVGGMIGYGPDFLALYRRAAVFVDKILKGAKPGDLPVERPSEFLLVVNSATARKLGVPIPESLRVRAKLVGG